MCLWVLPLLSLFKCIWRHCLLLRRKRVCTLISFSRKAFDILLLWLVTHLLLKDGHEWDCYFCVLHFLPSINMHHRFLLPHLSYVLVFFFVCVIFRSYCVQLILKCVRFEDGVFNHALAVALISENDVTLNFKSNQSVPIQ